MAYALTKHIHRTIFPDIHFMPATTFYSLCKKHAVDTLKLVSKTVFDLQWDECQLDYKCLEEYRQKRAIAVQDITKSACLHEKGFNLGQYPSTMVHTDEDRAVTAFLLFLYPCLSAL